ncbi:MAG TPA: SRPBCC family protein [Burkholderiales bacterium]|nr:SRPBCC family protein [Burkholderiales bacterium]
MNPLLIGGALGALAMYFLDGQSGRRRRARTRDQLAHVASARRLFQREDVSDEVLVERVRAALGRVVSQPHAIEVAASSGHVRLDGPILSHEVRALIRAVRRVAGVRSLDDRLTVYSDPEHLSSLQGGVPRGGRRFEPLQENWSPAARLLVGALGAGLMVTGSRAWRLRGSLLGLAGGGLLARAVTNRDFAALVGLSDPGHGITVQKTIKVHAPVAQVFAFWTDYQNFPRFMHNVRDVRRIDQHRSHWVVSGPAGVPVEWTAEVTRVEPNHLIEWRSTYDSDVKHKGQVRFDSNGDDDVTRVTVRLSYLPAGGAFGHAVAAVFGADPKSEMDGDLMRMKTMIETGNPPHDAAKRIGAPKES